MNLRFINSHAINHAYSDQNRTQNQKMVKTIDGTTKTRQRIVSTTIALSLITALLSMVGAFERFDLIISDVRTSFAQVAPSNQTVIVAIDQISISSLGGYPLSRSVLANVLGKIQKADARKTYIDVSFGYLGSKNDDDKLEAVLKEFNPNRVALPVTNFVENSAEGISKIVEIQSLKKFSRHVKNISGDIFPDSDGKTRHLGNIQKLDISTRPTVAAWLVESEGTGVNSFKIDFGINKYHIPKIKFVDILNGTVSPKVLKGKNVIVGLTTKGAVQNIDVPRYGNIQRPYLFAIAAETLQLNRNILAISKTTVVVAAIVTALLLGVWLLRYNALLGGLIAISTILSVFSLGTYLRSKYLIDLPIAVIVLSIFFTYLGVQINIHPSFARLRNALQAFLDKIDFSHLKLVHSANDAIVTFTPEGGILTMNGAAEEMFGLNLDNSIGHTIYEIMPEHSEKLLSQVADQKTGRMQAQLSDKNKSPQHIDMSYNALPTDEGWVGLVSIRDITEMKSREEKLSYAAMHDPLTGLANRAGFDEYLKATARFCTDTNQRFAVLLIDLDKFKLINDTLGHHVGDTVLEGVSARISGALRKSDFAARLGGDEFAIIMAAPVSIDNAETLAIKLISLISDPIHCDGEIAKVGASIGIAHCKHRVDFPEYLVQRADEAMYRAKKGRNGFAIAKCS